MSHNGFAIKCVRMPQRLLEEVAAATDSSVLARILEALLCHLGEAGACQLNLFVCPAAATTSKRTGTNYRPLTICTRCAGDLHTTLRVLLHHVSVRAVQQRAALPGKTDR